MIKDGISASVLISFLIPSESWVQKIYDTEMLLYNVGSYEPGMM